MTQAPADGLRDLVAATVRDVVAEMVASSLTPGALSGAPSGSGPSSPPGVAAAAPAPAPPGPAVAGQRRVDTVRIESDADLDAFARHLLQLFENPKNRQDLRAGRHTFRLAASATPQSASSHLAACRVEKGAVTERQVKAAAESQQRLVLGRAAVLTPLARERARALGVPIEKEH